MLMLSPIATTRRELSPRVLSLRVGLVHIRRRGDAFLVTVLRQIIGAVVDFDRILEKCDGRVVTAQGEVVCRQFRLQRQCNSGSIRLATLSLCASRRGGATQPTE